MVTVLTVAALMETDWRQKAGKDDLSQKAPAPSQWRLLHCCSESRPIMEPTSVARRPLTRKHLSSGLLVSTWAARGICEEKGQKIKIKMRRKRETWKVRFPTKVGVIHNFITSSDPRIAPSKHTCVFMLNGHPSNNALASEMDHH